MDSITTIKMDPEIKPKKGYIKVDKVQKELDKIKKLTCSCCNKLWRDSYKLKTHLSSKKLTNGVRLIRKDKKEYICGMCGIKKLNNCHLKKHLLGCNNKQLMIMKKRMEKEEEEPLT